MFFLSEHTVQCLFKFERLFSHGRLGISVIENVLVAAETMYHRTERTVRSTVGI